MHHDPQKFRAFHPELETIEIDGRGLTSEGRIRALTRCLRKVKPVIALPMSLVEANQAVSRCKVSGQDVRLMIHAQGNLPPMLADLRYFHPVIDHVVCPGRLTQAVLQSWAGFSAGRLSHIPNGAACAQHKHRDNRSGPLRLGFVGRFSQLDKRVLDMIGLVRQLKEKNVPFSLRIVGQGGEESTLRSALEEYPEVTFCGAMSQDMLYRDFYPLIDVLVLFSASEAFGIVLAEAMMNGVVPVTSQFIGFFAEKLVIEEGTGLSFPVGDVEQAANQIRRLYVNPELRMRLSEQGRQHAESNYRWDSSLKRWEECFRRVVDLTPLRADGTTESQWPDSPGRLDRLGVPAAVTDVFRRIRRKLIGPAVPGGGTEWPLHNIHYSSADLAEVSAACQCAEQAARTEVNAT